MGKIKKEVVFAVLIIFFIFGFLNLCSALGLTPPKTQIDFKPELEFSVKFRVDDASPGQKISLYTKGDLSEYVEFDKEELIGGGEFTATIKLPQFIEKPGQNVLRIGVKESREGEGGVGAVVALEGLIIVDVPYPGKYAGISLSVKNINVGEPLNFIVIVDNLGKEDITAKTNVEIYSDEQMIKNLDLGSRFIETQKKEEFKKTLNDTELKQGKYKAVAVVDYGKIAKAEREFKIGRLFVNITDWTKEFEKGKINPFDIKIESLWNNGISDIYASVNISKENKSVDYFKTPSVSIKPWEKTTLKGFFNAEKVKTGNYRAEIILFYEDKTTEKTGNIKVTSSKKIVIVFIVFIFGVLISYFFWRRYGWQIIRKKKPKK